MGGSYVSSLCVCVLEGSRSVFPCFCFYSFDRFCAVLSVSMLCLRFRAGLSFFSFLFPRLFLVLSFYLVVSCPRVGEVRRCVGAVRRGGSVGFCVLCLCFCAFAHHHYCHFPFSNSKLELSMVAIVHARLQEGRPFQWSSSRILS